VKFRKVKSEVLLLEEGGKIRKWRGGKEKGWEERRFPFRVVALSRQLSSMARDLFRISRHRYKKHD